MRILVVGGTGFIGSTVAARLHDEGHEVVVLSRFVGRKRPHQSAAIAADISKLTRKEDWYRYLKGVNAVVNCAGVLQDSPHDSTAGVHEHGVKALFLACEDLGIRRVIHLSAVGVDRATPTVFSKTKRAGDEELMALDLDWVILRPSVVVGRPAFGGSALFRGLSALPILPAPPETQELQIVQLDELVDTVVRFLEPDAPGRLSLDVVGPQRLRFVDVVLAYRDWLGWARPRIWRMPRFVAPVFYRLGDLVSLLGWRTPMRSTTRYEIARGAVGDPSAWTAITDHEPRSLSAALAAEPASVQESWFAKLYLLKPIVMGVFALFWIVTGVISLGPGWEIGMELMREGGMPETGPLLIVAGASADILIGLGIAYRPTARIALWAAFALSITYIVVGTVLVPRLWFDPLGPMLKIWPILALNLVALAILDER